MQSRRRLKADRRQIVFGEDVQRRPDDDSATRGRRNGEDLVGAVAELDGRAPDRLVLAQLAVTENAASGANALHELLGEIAVVEVARALVRKPLQSRGELRRFRQLDLAFFRVRFELG